MLSLLAITLLACRAVFGIPTIEIKGSKFFTSEGNQFFIKGITYQLDRFESVNGLTNGDQCRIDAKLIAATGANVVRAYVVDPTLKHDECMKAFEDAGIYVMCDITAPYNYINRTKPEWDINMRDQYAKALDEFHKYDNMLALFAGGSEIYVRNNSISAPILKAVIADMKTYRDLMQYRKIPIGFSTFPVLADELQDYLDCGSEDIAADFYAFTEESWCGDSSMDKSGYTKLYASANGYDMPVFIETMCEQTNRTRDFADQVAILGRDMNERFSGSIVYKWTYVKGDSKYGIASYDNPDATGTPVLQPDYTALKSRWATLSPSGVKRTTYNPSLTRRACPQSKSLGWTEGTAIPTIGRAGLTTPSKFLNSVTRTGVATSTAEGGNSTPARGSKVGGGAIAGIVVGAIAIILLLLGALLLLRRRRLSEAKTVDDYGAELDASVQSPYRKGTLLELPGARDLQELGPAQMQYELKVDEPITEMSQSRAGNELPVPVPKNEQSHERGEETSGETSGERSAERSAERSVPKVEPSPHVEAQRRREMEWLEMEEARMRQRRELLMNRDTQRTS